MFVAPRQAPQKTTLKRTTLRRTTLRAWATTRTWRTASPFAGTNRIRFKRSAAHRARRESRPVSALSARWAPAGTRSTVVGPQKIQLCGDGDSGEQLEPLAIGAPPAQYCLRQADFGCSHRRVGIV